MPRLSPTPRTRPSASLTQSPREIRRYCLSRGNAPRRLVAGWAVIVKPLEFTSASTRRLDEGGWDSQRNLQCGEGLRSRDRSEKSPNIVFEDADLSAAAAGMVSGICAGFKWSKPRGSVTS
jgi:hypothetical protein